MNEDNERWLSDGNCSLCRRKTYCSKPCKAQRKRKEAIIRQLIQARTHSMDLRRALKGESNG